MTGGGGRGPGTGDQGPVGGRGSGVRLGGLNRGRRESWLASKQRPSQCGEHSTNTPGIRTGVSHENFVNQLETKNQFQVGLYFRFGAQRDREVMYEGSTAPSVTLGHVGRNGYRCSLQLWPQAVPLGLGQGARHTVAALRECHRRLPHSQVSMGGYRHRAVVEVLHSQISALSATKPSRWQPQSRRTPDHLAVNQGAAN